MEITFTKMHGLGNDFIVINCLDAQLPDPSGFAVRYCHRRFGIGADQLLLIYPSDRADFKMKIFNADGSEVEMCGNGIRCFAKYIWDRKLSDKNTLEVETLAGIIKPELAGDLISVDMGEPIFEPEKIPVSINQKSEVRSLPPNASIGGQKSERIIPIIDYPLQIIDRQFKITCISMGNPHVVIFLDEDISGFQVHVYGPEIERHNIFPKRSNVEFVNVKNKSELKMRVWERGSGETMACGTGASAAAVAAMLKGLTNKKVTVHLAGGDLIIEWIDNNHVYMTGPAVEVFDGRIKAVTSNE
jgi:diaminopimelate epimerase